MNLEADLNELWRDYCKLLPEELRRPLWVEAAQTIARRDAGRLDRITAQGIDSGEHADFLRAYRGLVRDYWALTEPQPTAKPPKRVRRYHDIGGGIRAVEA